MHERAGDHERGDGKERQRVGVARESERDQGDQEACERSAACAEGEPETERDRRTRQRDRDALGRDEHVPFDDPG